MVLIGQDPYLSWIRYINLQVPLSTNYLFAYILCIKGNSITFFLRFLSFWLGLKNRCTLRYTIDLHAYLKYFSTPVGRD